MESMSLKVGSYGLSPATLSSAYEDECVGGSPQALEGIVVSRIDGKKVFVRDWHIISHFEGEHVLEQFEEAKHNQKFDFTFSKEHELTEDELLDGADPVLGGQLLKKLKAEQRTGNIEDKLKKLMHKNH